MATSPDVERFVGLLVSDDDFVKAVRKDFDAAVESKGLKLNKIEKVTLKEGVEAYVEPVGARVTGAGTVAAPVAIAVAAAVAGSVAGAVASKVVDKLWSSRLTAINVRLRESILHRGLLQPKEMGLKIRGPIR